MQLFLLLIVQVYIVIRLSQISSCRQSFRAKRTTLAEMKCFAKCNDDHPPSSSLVFTEGRDEVDA